MSIWIQIILGLLPAFVILLFYIVIMKKNLGASVSVAVLFLIFFSFCFTHKEIAVTTDNQNTVHTDIVISTPISREDTFQFIYSLTANEQIETASSVLDNYIREYGYDDSCALAKARILAVSQDFKAAHALYEKSREVWDNYAEQEYKITERCTSFDSADMVLFAHTEGLSESDFNLKIPSGEYNPSATAQQISDSINQMLDQENINEQDFLQFLSAVNEIYDRYLFDGHFERRHIQSLLGELEYWEKQKPELFSVEQVRNTRTKLQILDGNYSRIIRNLSEHSGYKDLMLASELYLNGFVKQSDFSEFYVHADTKNLTTVITQLKKIKESGDPVLSSETDILISLYTNYLEDGPMYQLKQNLLNHMTQPYFTDSSKVYLQLAKMELRQEHEDKAKEYVGMAMGTVSSCLDPEYTGPMYQVMGIMANKDDAESLKDVAVYASNILNNQLEITTPEMQSSNSVQSQFSGYFTDYVSMQRAAVNIVSVDASQFSQITAYVQIETSADYTIEELKNYLTIEDCGARINNYHLERVEYTSADLLLCCDVSGSMQGTPIEHSKAALISLADSMNGDMRLAVAFFNSSTQGTLDFTIYPESVRQVAEQMYAGGGTNIFGAVGDCINSFPREGSNILNTLIVMSDGQDGSRASQEQIQSAIGDLVKDKSILIHCLGLGPDVDANYLQSIAQSSGGTYQYVTDASSLSAFYQNLARQKNYTYKLQYTAEDTLTTERNLQVTLSDLEFLYDIEHYTLPGAENTSDETTEHQIDLIFKEQLSIQCLDTRFLFKSVNPANIKLLGSGFRAEDSISVKIIMDNGGTYGISYDIPTVFDNENAYVLTIPPSVACGVFDVRVTIDGKTAILDNELTIQVPGSEQTTAFGPYVFTSYQKITKGDSIQLNGYVSLNNWLQFKGEVVLAGDLNNTKIQIRDLDGSYIAYYSERSKGLAKHLCQNNQVLPLPPLNTLSLYNDIKHNASDDEYQVDIGSMPYIMFPSSFDLFSPGYSLYPDRIVIDAKAFSTKFPFQDKLMKSSDNSLFEFEVEELKGILTPDNIGIQTELELGAGDGIYSPVKLFNFPLNISPSGKLKIDTIKNEYEIALSASILFFGDGDVGFLIRWEDDLVPKKIMIKIPVEKTVFISGVPITFDKFELGVDDLDVNDFLNTKLVGKMDVSACSIQALVPQVGNYLEDDLSLLKLEDSTLTLRFKNVLIEAETTAKVLEYFEIGHAKLQIGNFSYSNALLGMDSEDVKGIHGEVRLGIGFDEDNCTMDISGTGAITATNRFIGLTGDGECHFRISWWILVQEFNKRGLSTIGYFEDHDGVGTFTIRFKASSDDGRNHNFSISASQKGLYLGEAKVF